MYITERAYGLIVGIKIGYPGSTHDSAIAREMPCLEDAQSHMHEDCFIAADKGFKAQPKVVRPNAGNVPPHLRQANKDATLARTEIECIFAKLFHNMFSRVNVWKGYKLDLWTKSCISSCLLYNVKILLDHGIEL